MDEEIYNLIDTTKSGISIKREEAEFMFRFLNKIKAKQTVEAGLFAGVSAAYTIRATKGDHYAMDPFQKDIKNIGLKNLKRLNLSKHLHFYNDYSHSVLPKLHSNNKKFDFAFVDGGHKYDEIFVDFYYIDLMLKTNGYILFHDTWMRSTQLVCNWIETNKTNYEKITTPQKNLALYKKIKEEDREWHHFNEFYAPKVLITKVIKFKLIRSLVRLKLYAMNLIHGELGKKLCYYYNLLTNVSSPFKFLSIKKSLKKETVAIGIRNGLNILIRTNTADANILEEIILWKQYKLAMKKLNSKNSIVIDVGAHIGIFSLMASLRSKTVYAYEPEPENFKLLLKNIRNNKTKNIVATNKAITDKKGYRKLLLNNKNLGVHSLYNLNDETSKSLKIQTTTLHDEIRRLDIPQIDLIKLDCEGAEFEIIKSLKVKDVALIKNIIFEYHEHEEQTFEKLMKTLERKNFRVKQLFEIRPGLGIAIANNRKFN